MHLATCLYSYHLTKPSFQHDSCLSMTTKMAVAAMEVVRAAMQAMGAALLGVVVVGASFTALNSSLFLISRPPLYSTSA